MRLFVLHGRLPERIYSLGGRRVQQVLFIKPDEIGISAVPTKITRLRTPMMAPNAAVAAPPPRSMPTTSVVMGIGFQARRLHD